ncbi:glycosyltransferase [Frankia sp. EI5c]|nr:glycosyltransferase [Frankia sp. EI5c]
MTRTSVTTPGGTTTVLHVFGVMDRGGAELCFVDLLRRFDPDRVRFVFVTLTGRPGALAGEIASLGGSVRACRLGPGFPVRFLRLLRELRPDVVHSHVATFSGVILLFARAVGVRRRVAHLHSTNDRHGQSLRGRAQRRVLRRLIDWLATDIIAVAEGVMTGMWRADWQRDRRCRVLYNGLDFTAFARAIEAAETPAAVPAETPAAVPAEIARAPRSIVHVGRPHPVKNRSGAVEVLTALHQAGVPARLRIVGREDPRESADLRRRAERGGVTHALELAGESFDVPGVLVAADLMLLTSHHEGLPTVVLEARAVGTPVLAPDLPGVVEIAGLLGGVTTVPQGAAPEVWAAAAAGLLTTTPTPRERRRALREFGSSPFVMERWHRELSRVWEQ